MSDRVIRPPVATRSFVMPVRAPLEAIPPHEERERMFAAPSPSALARYRILYDVAAGGMGVVYRAEDTLLQRPVAIKILLPGQQEDAGARARFLHSARAAFALDHRNVGAVRSVGETSDGQPFLVMDFYDGETLERRIEKGPSPEDFVLSVALQAAQGLARAHERKVVHRDIKPSNLLVTGEGEVKILDFGHAQILGEIDAPGRIAGTLHYMSPEQLLGKRVDHRSDIWSLGIVLYEMLAGHLPFREPRRSDVLASILHDDPFPLLAVRPDLRPGTGRLVEKALMRRPSARYESMADLAKDAQLLLAEPSLAPPPPASGREKSVLVRPFCPGGRAGGDELFARGLTEAVIADLMGAPGVRVVSRTAGAAVNASAERIRRACSEMNVEYLLEGTATQDARGGFSIGARLVETRTDFLAWHAKVDCDSVLELRKRLSRGIARALRPS